MQSAAACLLVAALAAAAGCGRDLEATFAKLRNAQRLTADMRTQLHRSAAASQRAVMADTDETSTSFSREAEEAARAMEADLATLEPLLRDLRHEEGVRLAQELRTNLTETQALDQTLLSLATQNTNAKAQRLAFGPAREAADAMRDDLEAIVRAAPAPVALRAELLATRAELAVREIQALEAPHIAEADDAAMSRLEQQMAASEATARSALEQLSKLLAPASLQATDSALQRLDRFSETHAEIVRLSRRNTDVRSLALSLDAKRRLTAACDATLLALQAALAKSETTRATR